MCASLLPIGVSAQSFDPFGGDPFGTYRQYDDTFRDQQRRREDYERSARDMYDRMQRDQLLRDLERQRSAPTLRTCFVNGRWVTCW
jgi:hypothetical protein